MSMFDGKIFAMYLPFMSMFFLLNFSGGISSGSMRHYADFSSQFTTARNIDVWLPDGYSEEKKYAVLYVHDGQMLFDADGTWNHQEWGMDEAMQQLLNDRLIQQTIVVAIWNSGNGRFSDYFPQKIYKNIPSEQKAFLTDPANGLYIPADGPRSDGYLKFIVKELKPFIDSTFSTIGDRQHTFIAGSSMGGLISLYALCEYPDIFGGAACLSTHWTGTFTQNNTIPAAINNYVKEYMPEAATHKIYFDHGTETLDALYAPHQQKIDSIFRSSYTEKNYRSLVFEHADHSETAWRQRLTIPLQFLLGGD